MKIGEKILNRIGLASHGQLDRLRGVIQAREFTASLMNRLTYDWNSTTVTIDADIRTQGFALRNRARDLAKNNAWVKRYLTLARVNVVGPDGFKLQMNARDLVQSKDGNWKWVPDKVANMMMENGFKRWSGRDSCTVSGKYSFRGVCDQVIEYLVRDGEAIVHIVRDKKAPYGCTLQVIDPMYLDEKRNLQLDNGSVIKMGVEIDSSRKPIAYHFLRYDPIMDVYGALPLGGNWIRIPAEEILHIYHQEYENQTRGYSWLTPVMLRLKMLDGYEEAALVNARASAAKMGFFTSTSEGGDYTGETDESGNINVSGAPGSMEKLPPGVDFKPYVPEYPTSQHEMFVKNVLRGIASGLNVSYNLLGNDLEHVNYSSIRAGLLDERDMWKQTQNILVEQFLNPIFAAWLEMAIVTGSLNLPFGKFDKFNSPCWIGRRWPWVDPLKDVESKVGEIQAGLTTRTQTLAEQGDDVLDVDAELAREKNDAEALGLTLSVYQPKPVVTSSDGGGESSGGTSDSGGNRVLDEVEELLKTKPNGIH